MDNFTGAIRLKNIFFFYPQRSEVVVFDNFNLTIPAGNYKIEMRLIIFIISLYTVYADKEFLAVILKDDEIYLNHK